MSRSTSCLLLAVSTLICTGCGFKDNLTAFSPARGNVCDTVNITGTIFEFGTLDGVWFNGTQAAASVLPDPSHTGNYFIQATVPPGATSGPLRAKISTSGVASILVKGTDHTFTPGFSVTGSLVEPQITSFTPAATTIAPGGSVTLNWAVSGTTTAVTLNGAAVASSGSETVQPSASTTYKLTAYNSCLQPVSDTASVKVSYQNGPFVVVPSTIPPTVGAHGTDGGSCSASVVAGGLSPMYADIKCGSASHTGIPLVGGDHYNVAGIGFFNQSLGVVASHSNGVGGNSQVTYTPVLLANVSEVLPGDAVLDTAPPSTPPASSVTGPQFFASPDGLLVITSGFGTNSSQFGPRALQIYNLHNSANTFTKVYYSKDFSAEVMANGSGQAVKLVVDGNTLAPYPIF